MTTRLRLAACLVACGLVVQIATGTVLAAAEPSPKPLWKVYPLDPTGAETHQRTITTSTVRPPPSGVAGVRTTVENSSSDDGTSVVFGLLLGGLAAAIFLLVLALVPVTAASRLTRVRADRRVDMALAGVLALLVATILYLATSS